MRKILLLLFIFVSFNTSFSQKKVIDVIKNHGWYNKTWSDRYSDYYNSFTKRTETQTTRNGTKIEEYTWDIKILKDNGKTLEYIRVSDGKPIAGLTYLIILYDKNNFRRLIMNGETINTKEDFIR